MNKGTWTGLLLALVLLAGGIAYYWYKERPPRALPVLPVAERPAPEQMPGEPQADYPLPLPPPAQAPETPLPGLDDSDGVLRQSLADALGAPPVETFLVPERLIRNIVATVDSLDGDPVRLRLWPVTRAEGSLVVTDDGGKLLLSPANAERYAAFVGALEGLDADRLVAVYLRYYPLFQKAYEELGYPGRYFNDRLIAIIDHLVATPVVSGPIELRRPKVVYEFTDPALQDLSWGRKTLVRIGPEHAAAVKQKLREIRAVLVARAVEARASTDAAAPASATER